MFATPLRRSSTSDSTVAFDGAHIWVANQYSSSANGFLFKL
jgi:hypothetical protein